MDKNNLIKLFSLKSGIKRNKCESIFDIVLRSITKDLKEKKSISINGFGEFKIIRAESKIIINENIKAIHPPFNFIEFNLIEDYQKTESLNSISKKKEIEVEIAEEFNLNNSDSETIVNSFFNTLKDSFRKNKILFLQRLGEFKTVSNSKVAFKPAKKLHRRLNSDFNDLEIVKVKLDENNISEEQDVFDYKMSDEFKNSYKEICESGEENVGIKTDSEFNFGRKKLISDELVKLHYEIVECDKTLKES